MTITRSDKKYFAGGVNPHDENFFGVIIEIFGTLNLNISDILLKETVYGQAGMTQIRMRRCTC